jgi:hypothetical protein
MLSIYDFSVFCNGDVVFKLLEQVCLWKRSHIEFILNCVKRSSMKGSKGVALCGVSGAAPLIVPIPIVFPSCACLCYNALYKALLVFCAAQLPFAGFSP